jgi:hypothetical protein
MRFFFQTRVNLGGLKLMQVLMLQLNIDTVPSFTCSGTYFFVTDISLGAICLNAATVCISTVKLMANGNVRRNLQHPNPGTIQGV